MRRNSPRLLLFVVTSLMSFSMLVPFAANATGTTPQSMEFKDDERRTYTIPMAFRNPYVDKIFKSVEVEKDPPFTFPTKPNVTLFTSFVDFINKTANMQIHPYAFQFPRSQVDKVLSGVFELALATMQDPPNLTQSLEFSDFALSDPLQKLRLEDCMSRCPNPDVYEPYPNPFLEMVRNAIRKSAPRNFKNVPLYRTLDRVPRMEGLGQHEIALILGEEKFDEHVHTEAEFINTKHNRTAVDLKFAAWKRAYSVKEHAERVGNATAKKAAEAKIAELEAELTKLNKAGFMWQWGRTMYTSNWDMNTFSRYMKWTPDVLEPLEWYLDHFASPFYNSGRFYYPPGATREWHTNVYSGGVGWRAYVVRKWPAGSDSGTRILHPNTGEVATMRDLDEMSLNVFRIGDIRAPNWHCVYSKDAHRFSLGMKLKDEDVYRVLQITGNALLDPTIDDEAEVWRARYKVQYDRIVEEERREREAYQARARAEKFRGARLGLAETLADVLLDDASAGKIAETIGNRILDRLYAEPGVEGGRARSSFLDKVLNALRAGDI